MKLPKWLENKWITLIYSKHALERFEERCKGCLQIKPSIVKLTKKNVVWWNKDEEKHVTLKLKIHYSRTENLILILQLDGTVKTIYYERKKVQKKTSGDRSDSIHISG